MHEAKEPSRKELLLFAGLMPVFLALLAWIAVARPAGLLIAICICTYGAVLGLLIFPGSWARKVQALIIPAMLLALYGLGRDAEKGTLIGGAVMVGLILGVMIAFTPLGRSVYTSWLRTAEPIGFAISMTVLALAYYLVITPVGWLMRTIRKDPMKLEIDRSAASYWIKHEPVTDSERYFRQF